MERPVGIKFDTLSRVFRRRLISSSLNAEANKMNSVEAKKVSNMDIRDPEFFILFDSGNF